MSKDVVRSTADIVKEIIDIVKRRKKVSISELSNMFGYSYFYFRYGIMKKVIAASNNCIEITRSGYALWICQES